MSSAIKLTAYSYDPLTDTEAGAPDPFPDDPPPLRDRHWRTFSIVVASFSVGLVCGLFYGWNVLSLLPSSFSFSLAASPNVTLFRTPPQAPFGPAPVRLHYVGEDSLNERPPLLDCPVPVIYTKERETADAIIFNSDKYDGQGLDRAKDRVDRPWQAHVIWGSESGPNRQGLYDHFRKLAEGRVNETFDFDMTYRLNGSVPGVYAYGYMNFANQPLPFEQKRQDKLAAAFISNCGPENVRNLVLDELMALLPGQIDSFGTCKNNANAESVLRTLGRWDMTGDSHTRWNVKITTLAAYKFTIAMENSNDLDYVTEKSFQAFEFGSVPIHLGSPSFNQSFQPAPNTAIDLADYLPAEYLKLSAPGDTPPAQLSPEGKAGMVRLADRLRHLGSAEGREDYERMLEWKKDEGWIESPLGKLVKLGRTELPSDCMLAGLVRGKEWGKSGWTPSSWT